jgi:hypothetical protein
VCVLLGVGSGSRAALVDGLVERRPPLGLGAGAGALLPLGVGEALLLGGGGGLAAGEVRGVVECGARGGDGF